MQPQCQLARPPDPAEWLHGPVLEGVRQKAGCQDEPEEHKEGRGQSSSVQKVENGSGVLKGVLCKSQ